MSSNGQPGNRDHGPDLEIGIIGAASIANQALITPAARVAGVHVAAVAARDPDRASRYARLRGIPFVHETYSDLLSDPTIDAVYIALPVALHARWTIAALRAGKHVLCEKPLASNALAAQEVEKAARESGRVLMEAYHTAYHPATDRVRELVWSGRLGRIDRGFAIASAPIPPGKDIRWNLGLGGGGMLDIGYYPLRYLRDLFGDVVTQTASARSKGEIDSRMDATLLHDSGVRARLVSGMWSWPPLAMKVVVEGERGRLVVKSPYHPQMRGYVSLQTDNLSWSEGFDRTSTYEFQLRAFVEAVRGAANRTDASAAVNQLKSIDAIYREAGLSRRLSAPATSFKA